MMVYSETQVLGYAEFAKKKLVANPPNISFSFSVRGLLCVTVFEFQSDKPSASKTAKLSQRVIASLLYFQPAFLAAESRCILS